jgi:hypothetical protein
MPGHPNQNQLPFIRSLSEHSREEILTLDPLGRFHVRWLDVGEHDAASLSACLDTAKSERDLQKYLEAHPMALVQHLRGGHGRYVIPQKHLGAEHVPDFIIGHRHSGGSEWEAVEIESSNSKMFTKGGDPTKELTHAVRQVQDWRAWLQRNQNYAARPPAEGGLGLTDIVSTLPGLIIIGRRKDYDPSNNDRRRQMTNDLNIKIHTYDFLLDNCRECAAACARLRSNWERRGDSAK